VDAGDDNATSDFSDLDDDLNVAEATPFDLAEENRFVNTVDIGAYEFFDDCNANGMPDTCDLDCGPPSGVCDLPGCGESARCNGTDWLDNGEPDDCDIAACAETEFYCDCNLNGTPDACEADPTPNECTQSAGACQNPDWSCGANWNLSGDYPDNNIQGSVAVTLGLAQQPFDALLDVSVTINSLRVLPGSSLTLSQPVGGPGDLVIAGNGDIEIYGDILNDRSIIVPDHLRIAEGGAYVSAVQGDQADGALAADVIAIEYGGQVSLIGQMTASASQLELHGRRTTGNKGSGTPPILSALDNAVLSVVSPIPGSATFILEGSVQVNVASQPLPETAPQAVTLSGDFTNEAGSPQTFAWPAGIFLTGGGPAERLAGSPPVLQFEVAGRDLGANPAGYAANFAMGTVEVDAGTSVNFGDIFDNDSAGETPCSEALYVKTLELGSGASVTATNCRVYYETLINNSGSQPIGIGCGRFIEADAAPIPLALEPTPVPKNRFLSFVVPVGEIPQETAIRVRLNSLHHPAAPPNAPNFVAFEGQYRYLNALLDAGNNPTYDCPDSAALGSSYKCAKLGCTPEYRDWAGIFGGSVVHVSGDSVVPSSTYDVDQLSSYCEGKEATCLAASQPMALLTERWGNVDNTPPGGAPSAIDISKIVDKVKDVPSAFIEPRCQLQAATPNPLGLAVNALDIGRGVDAVKGQPYPFTIGACP
jgi:hypothetical protein